MAEDDYCKGIDNSTNVAKFGPGQAWCLPKDYNQEKTPFTCKFSIIYYYINLIRAYYIIRIEKFIIYWYYLTMLLSSPSSYE